MCGYTHPTNIYLSIWKSIHKYIYRGGIYRSIYYNAVAAAAMAHSYRKEWNTRERCALYAIGVLLIFEHFLIIRHLSLCVCCMYSDVCTILRFCAEIDLNFQNTHLKRRRILYAKSKKKKLWKSEKFILFSITSLHWRYISYWHRWIVHFCSTERENYKYTEKNQVNIDEFTNILRKELTCKLDVTTSSENKWTCSNSVLNLNKF